MPSEQALQPDARIPFNKPWVLGTELDYVSQAIRTASIAGDGPFTQRCARLLEERFGIPKVMMTPSCTAALEMAAMLCGLGPGDEVILPSFTFVSTANAFVRLGARPLFVEIRPDTLNLDESRIEEAITPRTRAIFPVHYAGVACEMDQILATARDHNLLVVEDAAQGVNAFYKGRALGSIGRPRHLQLPRHQEPRLRRGRGALLQRPRADRAGRDPPRQGDQPGPVLPRRGRQVHLGRRRLLVHSQRDHAARSSTRSSRRWTRSRQRRRAIDRGYRERLEPLERAGLLRLPFVPEGVESHYRTFYIVLNSGATRDALMEHLKRNGVSAVFHFVPLHSSPMGLTFGYRPGDLPITEDLSGRLLRLPSFAEITDAEQDRVVDLVAAFLRARPARHADARARSRAWRTPGGVKP